LQEQGQRYFKWCVGGYSLVRHDFGDSMGRFREDPGLLWTEKMILVIAMHRVEQWVKGSIVILLFMNLAPFIIIIQTPLLISRRMHRNFGSASS
jgi:hypothetical protein